MGERVSRGEEKRIGLSPGSCIRTRGEKVPWLNLAEETDFVGCRRQGVHLKAEGAGSVQVPRSEVSLEVREAPKENGSRGRGIPNLWQQQDPLDFARSLIHTLTYSLSFSEGPHARAEGRLSMVLRDST